MNEKLENPLPEYGSDEYYQALHEEHNEQAKAFENAGWRLLNVVEPFYNDEPAKDPEGTTFTVCSTKTQPQLHSGYEWWYIEGDTEPPEGAYDTKSVYKVENGKWTNN